MFKEHHYWLLLGAIYIAPGLHRDVRIAITVVCVVLATLYGFKVI